MRLGEVLRKWRLMSELNVREVAERIGISPATYSRVERGEGMDGRTLAAVMRWMFEEVPETFETRPAGEVSNG